MLFPSLSLVDGMDSLIRGYYKKKHERQKIDVTENYDFMVLIPANNAVNTLERALSSLGTCKDRVLVVDDRSNDETAEIARRNGVRVIINPTNGKKVGAIAKGLESIDATYVVLMDADTCIEHGKLGNLTGRMQRENVDACAVRVMPSTGNGLLEKLQHIEYAKAMSIGRCSMDGDKPFVPCVSGAFGVFRIDMLKKVTEQQIKNGIHWEGEDFERTLRFIEKGARISYYNEFAVMTDVPVTLKDYTKQRIKWQHGYLRCHWDFKKMLMRRDKLGITFAFNYVFNLIGHPLKLLSIPMLIVASTIHIELFPLFYGIYCLIEALIAKASLSKSEWRKLRKYIPLMPLYGLYHLIVPTTIGYSRFLVAKLINVDERKKFRLAKCPECKRFSPYKQWKRDTKAEEWTQLKISEVRCRRCGTMIKVQHN